MTVNLRSLFAFLAGILFIVQASCSKDKPALIQPQSMKTPAAVIFEIDGAIPQFSGTGGLLPSTVTSQYKLTSLVKRAMKDVLVSEIIFHFGAPEVGWARAGEISDLIASATTSGKPVTCHLESPDNRTYWMAARACPQIVISPAGSVDLVGLSLESVFMKDLLDSLGVTADMLSMGRYKDAAESLTRTDMSPDARIAAEALLTDLNREFIEGISRGRKIDAAKVTTLINGGPYSASKALKAGLADRVETLGNIADSLRNKYPGGVLSRYGKAPPKALSFTDIISMFSNTGTQNQILSPKVALISALGPVVSGGGDDSLLGGMDVISDVNLIDALSKAAHDPTVRAVVLRIDSPGGSALASDNIWHAVRKLAAVKPVVASMGDVAASGGYYIASAATEIFASSSTITGSIGVVGGKMVLGVGLEKIGIHSESIKKGRRAGITSPFHPFNEEERAAITSLMQETYNLFVDRVVTGRKLDKAKVLAVAEGRVWTGTQALKTGLVDKTGTLANAITRARELAQMPDAPVVLFPKPKSFMDIIGEQFANQDTSVLAAAKRFSAGRRALALTSCLLKNKVIAFSPMFLDIR